MKRVLKYKLLLLVALAGCSLVFSSCEDNNSLPPANALFRPILTSDDFTLGGTTITAKWNRYTGADWFDLMLVDAYGDTIKAKTDTTTYTFTNLTYDTQYTFMIRSHSNKSGLESKYFVYTDLSTNTYDTNLNVPTSADEIDTQVRVSWTGATYDTMYISQKAFTGKDSLIRKVPVPASANTAGQLIVKNLKSNTTYKITAYYQGQYFGYRSYKTAVPQYFSGAVIDLRGRDVSTAYTTLSTDSLTAWLNKYPNQNLTIVLDGGITYRMPQINVPATTGKITFVTGLSLNGNANFAVSGSIIPYGSIGGLTFQKIFFTEAPLEGASYAKGAANFGGTYVINCNQVGYHVGKLDFESCSIKYKRGIVRVQATTTIDSLDINNCIVDSIGSYGVVNTSKIDQQVNYVGINNSTIAHAQKLLVCNSNTAMVGVNIANCTFSYDCTSGVYLFDFNSSAVTNGISINNSIFGPSYDGNGICSYRIKSGTFTMTGCYCTSDLTWFVPTGGTSPTSAFGSEVTVLSGGVAAVWKNPTNSDFTVINSTVKSAKCGDPRWLQ